MPIVISEFEIVPDPPVTDAGTPLRAPDQPKARAATPYDVELAIGHLAARDARVKAD